MSGGGGRLSEGAIVRPLFRLCHLIKFSSNNKRTSSLVIVSAQAFRKLIQVLIESAPVE